MNAEQAKPEIVLEFLDRKRKAVFNLAAMRALEELEGKSIMKILRDINWGDLRISDISKLLWASLHSDDPDLTVAQVEEIFDLESILANVEPIKALVSRIIARAMPVIEQMGEEADSQKKTMRKAARKLTGLNSSQSERSNSGSLLNGSGT